jgi:F-type H+-transporting ATPase subunit delta
MSPVVASRYARALADVVLRPGSGIEPATAAGQLRAFEEVLAASAELRNALLSPAVAPVRKRAVVSRLGGALGLTRVVENFLFVIIDHRRIALLAQIRQALEGLLDERLGVVRAEVASACRLTEPQRAALAAELTQLTGKRVRCEFSTDEALVGGVKTRIGSTIYDGSVRGQLDSLRRRMVEQAL